MNEAFDYMKNKIDDEYEMFERLIASKLKNMKNPNTRDVLMNDIHNLVLCICMADRLEQQSAEPAFSNRTNPGPSKFRSPHHQMSGPSPNSSTYQSPPDPSKSQTPHHHVSSPSPNSSSYQSLPHPFPFQTPHHQIFSTSPNPTIYQSPPDPSTFQSPHHEIHSPSLLGQFSNQSPQDSQELLRAGQLIITDSGEIKILKDTL